MTTVIEAAGNGNSIFELAHACICACEPQRKCELTEAAVSAWSRGDVCLHSSVPVPPIDRPGRPERPRLVAPGQVPRRTLKSAGGRGALLHALAHIEFNAVNLAWDAVYRFRGLPAEYYSDWVRVAGDESRHFQMLCRRLEEVGFKYGDFDAHDGLWQAAIRTGEDVLARMAIVPRVLEARGLDVTPSMIARFEAVEDFTSAGILRTILEDEIIHVGIGSCWFRYVCETRSLDPETTFTRLVVEYMKGSVKGPLEFELRKRAGFSAGELDHLQALCR